MEGKPITEAFLKWFESQFHRKFDEEDGIDLFIKDAWFAGIDWCKRDLEKPTMFQEHNSENTKKS